MVVTPRGGGRQVGRSCYQVDTQHSTILVDCGLSQSPGGQFPDLRGLEIDQIDAVILTHAHIDHCGGLPLLENSGFLEKDAPIITTAPTAQLSQTLLDDSLKIHKRESNEPGKQQRFTEADVTAVYERFQTVEYDEYLISDLTEEASDDPLSVRFGNAGHLLGSAWMSLQTGGKTVVFSGDLGGRADHLPHIEQPPEGDQLFIESTYGARHSHQSMGDAETELWKAIESSVRQGNPVLIPTFAVGRAQHILRLLKKRFHTLPTHLRNEVSIVVDGMAQDACQIYQTHTNNDAFFSDSLVNEKQHSTKDGDSVILPNQVTFPTSDADRREILDHCDPTEPADVPIIVAPSGMLTGGHSPRYLTEMVSRYEGASVLLAGYQANGTGGNRLTNGIEAGESEVTLEFDTHPFGTDWPHSDRVTRSHSEEEGRITRVRVPLDWVDTIDGLSAHTSQMGLLSFARNVSPETITLIHGPAYAQQALGNHFIDNVESAHQVARARLLTPVEVTTDPTLETSALTSEMVDNPGHIEFEDRLDNLTQSVGVTNRILAETKQEAITDRDDIRAIVREELIEAGLIESH